MTRAEISLLMKLATKSEIFSWTDVVALPNGAKNFGTRMSRNATIANSLIVQRFLVRANDSEQRFYREAFHRQTARIIGHLQYATSKQNWKRVAYLAEQLQHRTMDRQLFKLSSEKVA